MNQVRFPGVGGGEADGTKDSLTVRSIAHAREDDSEKRGNEDGTIPLRRWGRDSGETAYDQRPLRFVQLLAYELRARVFLPSRIRFTLRPHSVIIVPSTGFQVDSATSGETRRTPPKPSGELEKRDEGESIHGERC